MTNIPTPTRGAKTDNATIIAIDLPNISKTPLARRCPPKQQFFTRPEHHGPAKSVPTATYSTKGCGNSYQIFISWQMVFTHAVREHFPSIQSINVQQVYPQKRKASAVRALQVQAWISLELSALILTIALDSHQLRISL